MKITFHFAEKHPDLFEWLPADHIFPHDHLMARTVLKLFPNTITPNQVTAVRILATPFVLFLIISGNYLWGTVSFLLAAFTDAIDGSMARTRNQITRFGMLFDPLADKLLIGVMVLLLVFQNFHYLLGFALIGLEVAVIITAAVAKVKFNTVKAANAWGKIKMISQVFAVFLTLLALVLDIPYLLTAAAWIFGLAIGFAIISLFAHGI
ncbi:MAG: hypothetical protein A3J66_02980 [Candidatus Magasanikbacteria bacterium RIFCSPHIGHO2_02_FULL_47_14]|uniref:CDP-diacylglycerol--glycerol-3-phosphate 3-phosphatidyltransferase n=1 Tax=Candidatus Magasanikbacteria bacterium RIFCSPHIGHO2_02_FULL_47_14 TaxID=1798680 RepID=A0A1F6M7L9_9BACT|nr:MAG: hypothetical protein A3J66_02980 [Candidatus Magasanikbacteria bacterium RIFCSPHIGHO2_02_FULL_47_14]